MSEILRIANCSGFYGDRLSAAREMVEGGPIDVLTGDYLAELTLMILLKDRLRDASLGYARTFLRQLEQVAVACKEREIKIVVNAGGLNPSGCAAAARDLYKKLGVEAAVAHIEGDDILERLPDLQERGEHLAHLDTGAPLSSLAAPILSANAYLGAWGIAAALERGADLVICPRVTDAALTLGPAIWKFGWSREDWDRLAAGVVAGHIIECGPQCTGGNYAFFEEVPGLEYPGFPIAEMNPDGTFVITKHPRTGGVVSVGTVTAQMLYEVAGPRYANPDVTARVDTARLGEEGGVRVPVYDIKGEPPPATTKVCINYFGGYRNTITFILTGLQIEAKARLAEETMWRLVGGREQFEEARVSLQRADTPDPASNEEAFAYLTITVKDRDPAKVGRAFSSRVVEMALASYPGFFMTAPPRKESQFGVYWPTLVRAEEVDQRVVIGGEAIPIPPTKVPAGFTPPAAPSAPRDIVVGGPARNVPLGTVCGARSGDKGGNANVGIWVRTPAAYGWLLEVLTVDSLRALLRDLSRLVAYFRPLVEAMKHAPGSTEGPQLLAPDLPPQP